MTSTRQQFIRSIAEEIGPVRAVTDNSATEAQVISLEDDIAQSMERALIFGEFLKSLSAPTQAQLWLERAAAQLDAERDPDGSRKQNRAATILRLLNRDGPNCWFCDRALGEDVTIEHLQPRALGGNWGEGNLALAHSGCNKAASHLSRIQKEDARAQLRKEREGN